MKVNLRESNRELDKYENNYYFIKPELRNSVYKVFDRWFSSDFEAFSEFQPQFENKIEELVGLMLEYNKACDNELE